MLPMNEMAVLLSLRDQMDSDEGWGRSDGRLVYARLLNFIEAHPESLMFRISFKGVRRIDISFASETLVELTARYLTQRGICIVDLTDVDVLENIDAAAQRKGVPLMAWVGNESKVLGLKPSAGVEQALKFALSKRELRTAEFAAVAPSLSMANISMKFKQLFEQGFLLRREETAESGGKEYTYMRVG